MVWYEIWTESDRIKFSVLTPDYKTSIYVKIATLLIDADEHVEAERYLNKAAVLISKCKEPILQLKYKVRSDFKLHQFRKNMLLNNFMTKFITLNLLICLVPHLARATDLKNVKILNLSSISDNIIGLLRPNSGLQAKVLRSCLALLPIVSNGQRSGTIACLRICCYLLYFGLCRSSTVSRY